MGFGFLCCVFAGEAEDVFWKGQRGSAAGGSWAVLCQGERPWPVLWWGLVPSPPSFPLCYFVTSSRNARKALSLFGGGEEQDKLQNTDVVQRGTLDTSGSLNLWNERFISAPTQKLELSS